MFKKIITGFLLFPCMCLMAQTKEMSFQSIEKGIETYQKKVANFQKTINKSTFDNDEVLIKLDFDADNIVEFMQDKFTFQPYVGLLRGVQGTLNSRSGNALDQAVLLAKLLGDAGWEVKISNGVLGDKDLKVLIASTTNATLPTQIGQGKEYNLALAKFNLKTPDKIEWQNSETMKRYQQSKETIDKLFKENNISLTNRDITHEIMTLSKDYFWVEYRMNSSDDWISAHPAFAKGYPVNVKALSYIKGNIPKKYFHTIKIEAFIQQRIGKELKTHSLMPAWEKPVANLNNYAISYTNGASGVKLDYNLEQIVKDTTYFIPTFNGQKVGSQVFDLSGRLIDADAMQSGSAGGLFQTIADKTSSALGKVAGNESGQPLMQLTAQWLQFTFTQPDGSSFVQKRYIYQATDYKVDEDSISSTKLALMTQYKFLVSTGEQSPAYLMNIYLNLINAGIPMLKASAKKLYATDKKVSFPKQLPNSAFELFSQYQLMKNNPNLENNIIRYKSNANLIGFKRGFGSFKSEIFAVDIINNRQTFIQNKGGIIVQQAQVSMNQGVWETASEWLPVKSLGVEEHNVDTLNITSAALKQSIELKVINAKNPDYKAIERIFSGNTDIINRAKEDIINGYSLLLPVEKPQNLKMSGWWRINLETGETLGMTTDGGGQSATEYAIQVAQDNLFLIRAIGNLNKCQSISNNVAKMCCLAEAHNNNVGGLGFGMLMGGVFGTAGAAVFDVIDFGNELVTGTGIAPSTNGALCK